MLSQFIFDHHGNFYGRFYGCCFFHVFCHFQEWTCSIILNRAIRVCICLDYRVPCNIQAEEEVDCATMHTLSSEVLTSDNFLTVQISLFLFHFTELNFAIVISD